MVANTEGVAGAHLHENVDDARPFDAAGKGFTIGPGALTRKESLLLFSGVVGEFAVTPFLKHIARDLSFSNWHHKGELNQWLAFMHIGCDSLIEILCEIEAKAREAIVSSAVVVNDNVGVEGVFGLDSTATEVEEGFLRVGGAAFVEALKCRVESGSEDECAFGVRGAGVDELVFGTAVAGEERFEGGPVHG